MNDIIIIFCHGFGFNRHFWDNLLDCFQAYNTICPDLGYFSSKYDGETLPNIETSDIIKNSQKKIIGVGHSLGMIKLLQTEINFDALIGLNSFINFLGSSDDLRYKRMKELNDFRHSFLKSPKSCLTSFYKRCDIKNHIPCDLNLLNHNRLERDIDALGREHSFGKNFPTLVLGSKDDTVVPESVLHENFDNLANVELEILKLGSHALGYVECKKVSVRIKHFIQNL